MPIWAGGGTRPTVHATEAGRTRPGVLMSLGNKKGPPRRAALRYRLFRLRILVAQDSVSSVSDEVEAPAAVHAEHTARAAAGAIEAERSDAGNDV